MFSLTTSAFLIILYATYVSSNKNQDPRTVNVIKLDLKAYFNEPVACGGYECMVCKELSAALISLKVCIRFIMNPIKKSLTLGIEFQGMRIISFPISVNIPPMCLSTDALTRHGQSGLCFASPMFTTNRSSMFYTFKVCPTVYILIDSERFAGIDFTCWEYVGDLMFVNENPFKFVTTINRLRLLS